MSQKYGMLNDGGYGANVMAPYPAQPPAYGAAQPPPPSPQLQPQQPQQQQQGPPPSNATILVQQQTAPVPWKWSTTICSGIALWLCCAPLAFCGMLYAIHSYVDHKTHDYTRSNSKLRMAWICTISSIAIGVIFWVIFIVCYAVIIAKASDHYNYRIH